MAKRKLTIEQEKQILKLYNEGYLVNDLKLLYGFKTNKSILDIVKRNGGKIRTFQETLSIKNPNRNISFDKINSPYKAYFIGLMLTDGWVRKDGGEFFICSMSIDFIKWCKRVLEKYYKFFEINLIKDNKGLYYIRTSDERNMMLLYIHIYYDNFAMDRKRNYLVQRFREHNGRN